MADGPVKLRDHYGPDDRPLVQGMVEAAAKAVRLGKPAQATAILAALPLVPPSLHVFMDSSYWIGELATYIARQVIACCASGTPIGPRDLLPRELAEHAATLTPNLPDAEFITALKEALDADYQAKAKAAQTRRKIRATSTATTHWPCNSSRSECRAGWISRATSHRLLSAPVPRRLAWRH